MGPHAVITVHVVEPKWSRDVSGRKEKELPSCADALQGPPDAALGDSLERGRFLPRNT